MTMAAGAPAVFALTRGGTLVAGRIAAGTGGTVLVPEERAREVSLSGPAVQTFDRLGPALREAFIAGHPCVCVLAAGIAVRLLAPLVSDDRLSGKHRDPAVVVVDESGRFAVPLLAGHEGGANALAHRIAEVLGGQAVITTSTDVQGLVSPDMLAQRLDAAVRSPGLLTAAAGAIANGDEPELWFDREEMGGAAEYLEGLPGVRARRVHFESAPAAISPAVAVTAANLTLGDGANAVLQLIPRWTVAGVGCKKGSSGQTIVGAIEEALAQTDLHPLALRGIATAEVKADEAGLAEAAERLGVPLWIGPNADLRQEIERHGLAGSDFVDAHAGVEAVSEPAALWGAGSGSVLVAGKRRTDGVTVALARADGATALARTEETQCLS